MRQIKIMQSRMQMYRQIRDFFDKRDVDEVETPILSPYGSTDVHIDSFVTHWSKNPLYLHTSPEFAMKYLLANGFNDCFQVTKVFRHEETGSNHRPEFTMLEWYRLGFNLSQLMNEVTDIFKALIPKLANLAVEHITYADAFVQIDINPHRDDLHTLKNKTQALLGYLPNLDDNRDEWLDFLLVTQIESKLGKDKLTFLTHYPASMAALARKSTDLDGNKVAERFELYYQGIELANGFDELTDAQEQRKRFEDDNMTRKALGKTEVPMDDMLIKALTKGLPNCAGVALGLDRLLMLALEEKTLDNVMVFSSPSSLK